MASRIRTYQKKNSRIQTPDESNTPAPGMFEPRSFEVESPQPASQHPVDINTALMRSQRYGHNLSQMQFAESSGTSVQPKMRLEQPLPFQQVTTAPLQAKLSLGQPGDKYEQEADRVAARVTNQMQSGVEHSSEQPAHEPEHPLSRQRRKKKNSSQPESLNIQPLVQRVAAENTQETHHELEESIEHKRGKGQPLSENIRQPMEKAFGADFSGVKVHTDVKSDRLNRSIQARAFTTGQDVFFRQGAYEPGSKGGQELLAHELTHVVQQNNGVVKRVQAKAETVVSNHGTLLTSETRDWCTPLQNSSAVNVQRKVEINENGTKREYTVEDFVKDAKASGFGYEEVVKEVLENKPKAVREAAENQLKVGNESEARPLLEEWFKYKETYTYPNDKNTRIKKIFRDALKYHLYINYNWRSIGAPEYMTGDATGLAAATIADKNLTVKIITGNQYVDPKNKDKKKLTFLKNSDSEPSPNSKSLPDYFSSGIESDQIVFSDNNKRKTKEIPGCRGTSDRYAKVYNQHNNDSVKPWNKETYEATKAIGEKFKDDKTREEIRSMMQLGDSDQDTKKKIEEYKQKKLDHKIKGKKCIFLWGRTSGKGGGAHKELDSHPRMILQLAQTIQEKFKDRILIFVGDEAVTQKELQEVGITNQMIYMGAFWKSERSGEEYANALKDRNAQRYLFSLFDKENEAVSIGMRSGSLEGLALLGMPVIFIDDKYNNAAGRMEYWAGKAADERAEKWKNMETEKLKAWEKENEGPMPNYKRVATLLEMGDTVEQRDQVFQKAKQLLDDIKEAKDATGQPVCNEEGNEDGNNLISKFIQEIEALQKQVDQLVTSSAENEELKKNEKQKLTNLRQGFTQKVSDLIKDVNDSNYMGTKAISEESKYNFNESEIESIKNELQNDLSQEAKQALTYLEALSNLKDAVSERNLVNENPTSPEGQKLLMPLPLIVKKEISLQKAAKIKISLQKAAETFNKKYLNEQEKLPGKQAEAQAGTIRFDLKNITTLENTLKSLKERHILQFNELQQICFLIEYLRP